MSILQVLVVGVTATVLADVWQKSLSAATGLPSANWALIGRWVAGFRHGVFVHDPIWASPEVAGERILGWIFHYVIGVIYGAAFLAIVMVSPATLPVAFVALAFGLVTIAAPWFVMQPALGLGVMAAHATNRLAVRLVTLSTHLVFGVGLYVGWLVWETI